MTNLPRNSLEERDVEQAITALKRGSHLLKYGRRGKPKFCPFRLSDDETTIIWYVGKEEKQLQLRHVSRIIPGQRTPIFQRYPQPEKEYQSFSLIYGNRSLDLICKHKDEAEIWFVALRALISRYNCQNWGNDSGRDSVSSDNSSFLTHRTSHSFLSSSSSDIAFEDPRNLQKILVSFQSPPQKRLGRALSDCIVYNTSSECSKLEDFLVKPVSSQSFGGFYDPNDHSSADTSRFSISSAISSSSQGSPLQNFNSLGDTFIWGQGIGNGLLAGGSHRTGKESTDSLLPKALESTSVVDAKIIACGSKHAALVTKNGEIFSWGNGSGGKLGQGIESDFSNPKLISSLNGVHIESVACGENHTLAVTLSGDLYSWGDGIHNYGVLGHGNELSQWTPKKIRRSLEGMHVLLVSCGPWHSAAITSAGILFTFGEGIFGALGHGDRSSTSIPREVETLKGLRAVSVSCGVWHTAAIVGSTTEPAPSGKLFTWGDGDKGQLGHGDKEPRLVPSSVAALNDTNFVQVACGNSITVALTTFGQVYTMGSPDYGQLGSPGCIGKLPVCIEGKIKNNFIEEIACGSHHVAVLSSKSRVYTWGKGANGQLGHGDNFDRNTPTMVEALRDKQARSVACGSNFTAIICVHKRASADDQSMCSGCQSPFNFIRKRHNCYNCGLFFCNACTIRKSLKASLAPDINKPYRVCEDCFDKLNNTAERKFTYRPPAVTSVTAPHSSSESKEPDTLDTRARRLLARLSSFNSFKIRNSKRNMKQISNNGHASPIMNQNSQCESFPLPKSSTSIFDSPDKISASLPVSTMHSRAASPVSVKSSPSHSVSLSWDSVHRAYPEFTLDDSKKTNENLTKEIYILKEQVDLLAQRSQLLESEHRRMSGELKEATELARSEREKNIAAMEVIKSLTIQLQDMGGRVPQESSLCRISDAFSETPQSDT